MSASRDADSTDLFFVLHECFLLLSIAQIAMKSRCAQFCGFKDPCQVGLQVLE